MKTVQLLVVVAETIVTAVMIKLLICRGIVLNCLLLVSAVACLGFKNDEKPAIFLQKRKKCIVIRKKKNKIFL